MELTKTKYKQTEIGLIPEDWEVDTLDNMATLLSSKRIFESEYVKDGIPFYRGKEISMLLDRKKIKSVYYISNSRYEKIKREFGVPVKGDILITAVGTLGNSYLIPNNNKFYFKDGNLIWLKNINGVNKTYLNIQLDNFKEKIIANAIGSSQKALTIAVLRKQKIPLPPFPEQKAIADVLSDVDSLIQAIEQKLAKKRAIKQGAMQKLLTPPTTSSGQGKENWEVKKLGDVFEIRAGGDLNKYDYSKIKTSLFKYPVYSNAHSNKGLYGFSKTFDFNGNYLTVSARGGIGYSVSRNEKFNAIGRLLILKPIEKINVKYVEEYINLKIEFSVESTGVPQLTAPQISKYTIALPSIEEQTHIATILSDMDKEIELIEAQLAKHQVLKQGLMQELLTGKIRLTV